MGMRVAVVGEQCSESEFAPSESPSEGFFFAEYPGNCGKPIIDQLRMKTSPWVRVGVAHRIRQFGRRLHDGGFLLHHDR